MQDLLTSLADILTHLPSHLLSSYLDGDLIRLAIILTNLLETTRNHLFDEYADY